MNLLVWLPLMFGLGLISLMLFLLFVDACERISGDCHGLARCSG